MRWTILAASLSFASGFGLRWAAYGRAEPADGDACREALVARVDATRTRPAAFPADPAVQPAAVLVELGGYAAACPWVVVVRVDCSEYPCLVVQDGLCPPQMAAGWSWMLPEAPSGWRPEVPDVYQLARYDADRTAQLRVPAGAAQRMARDRLAERIAAIPGVTRSGDGSSERSQELRWLVDATLESGRMTQNHGRRARNAAVYTRDTLEHRASMSIAEARWLGPERPIEHGPWWYGVAVVRDRLLLAAGEHGVGVADPERMELPARYVVPPGVTPGPIGPLHERRGAPDWGVRRLIAAGDDRHVLAVHGPLDALDTMVLDVRAL